jgi:hypothetical protein
MTINLKSTAFGLALLLVAGPSFASSEAPYVGQANPITSPAFTTAGAEGPAMFAAPQAGSPVLGGVALSSNSEAYVGQKG